MAQNISITNVINVTVSLTPQGLQVGNINTAALISREVPQGWDEGQLYAVYVSPTQVGEDFGTDSDAFAMAVAFFSQTPSPVSTSGYLTIIPRTGPAPTKASLAIQDLTYSAAAFGTGGNDISVAYSDGATAGAEVVSIVGEAITVQIEDGVSTATQVKAAVDASLAAMALVTVAITGTAGDAQTAPVAADNLAGGGAGTQQTVLQTIIATLNSVYYFAVLVDEEYDAATAAFTALSNYIQSIDKVLIYTTSDDALMSAGYLNALVSAGNYQTRLCYYGSPLLNGAEAQQTQMFSAAYAGRALSTDFAGNNTCITMNLKQLATIPADGTLDQSLVTEAVAEGFDILAPIANFTGLLTSGANRFWDQVYNAFWLQFALEVAGFNALALTNTKVPQTEIGMTALKRAYSKVMGQAVTNGYLAAGLWDSTDIFGPGTALVENIAQVGYYIYSLPIAQQSASDRTQRKAPLVQIAGKEAGALHSSNVTVSINP